MWQEQSAMDTEEELQEEEAEGEFLGELVTEPGAGERRYVDRQRKPGPTSLGFL